MADNLATFKCHCSDFYEIWGPQCSGPVQGHTDIAFKGKYKYMVSAHSVRYSPLCYIQDSNVDSVKMCRSW